MTESGIRNWTTLELSTAILFVVFAIAMLPPVLWIVNEPTLIGGYPILYLWAVGWGIFGTALLYWTVRNDLFGIATDQIPPEIADQDALVTTGTGAKKAEITDRGDD